MYRFLLFAYRSYEERGGMSDLALKFNMVEELQEAIKENDRDILGLGLTMFLIYMTLKMMKYIVMKQKIIPKMF